jgi:hypothetical protein
MPIYEPEFRKESYVGNDNAQGKGDADKGVLGKGVIEHALVF